MNNQDPKIKKVIDTLAEGSRSVQNNPSEQNYREWEGKLEQAGKTSWTPYIVAGVIVIVCISAFVVFSGGAAATQIVNSDNSQIENVYVEHNVYENSQKGMRIYIDFDVDNRKNVTCMAVAYFYFDSGEILKDFNGYYTTENSGQVAVGESFTPPYDSTQYTDLTLFMPYDELHMGTGDFDLKFQIELYERDSGYNIAESNYFYFQFSSQ